jgi:hypothetical protein
MHGINGKMRRRYSTGKEDILRFGRFVKSVSNESYESQNFQLRQQKSLYHPAKAFELLAEIYIKSVVVKSG